MKPKITNFTTALLFFIGMAMALCGCQRNKSDCFGQSAGYVQAKQFLEANYDSLYANPTGLRARLSKLQQQMPDSDGWYVLQMYNDFESYIETGDEKAFLAANDSVLAYCNRNPESVNVKASCLNLRSIVMQATSPDSSIACLKEAFSTLRYAKDKTDQVLFLINLADLYRMTNRQPEASLCLHSALGKSDSIGYDKMRVGINMGLGQVYSDMNQFEMSARYFSIADSLLTEQEQALGRDTLPYVKDRFLLESTIGNSLYAQGGYEGALECFKRAKKAADILQNHFYSFSLYINLSEVFALLNNLDSAKYYMEKAESITVRGLNIDADFYCNTIAADIALRDNNLAEAQRILSIPYDKNTVNKQYQQIRHRKMCDFYARKGDYHQAYIYESLVDRYDDSIRNVQTQINIEEMNLRYMRDTTLLNKNLVIAKHEARIAKTNLVISICVILLVIALGMSLRQRKKWRQKNEQLRSEAQNKILQLRMNAMYNRASPHLVFNAVNNAKEQCPEPIFDKLTDVLRDNLLLSDRIALPLSEEIHIVKNYAELYKLTHDATPKLVFDIADNVNSDSLVPAMCIQIPVENALKHAFKEMKGGEEVTVVIRQTDRTMITISDNGIGFQPANNINDSNSTGNGFKLIFEEYQILNSLNEEKITFNISENEGKGTKIEITIPTNYEYIHNNNN